MINDVANAQLGPAAAAFNVEKLDGVRNYHLWKFQMRMALTLENLWECVDYADGSPFTDSARDQKALARICLSVRASCVQHVRTAKTAKEAWRRLRDAYEDKGLFRRVVLLRQLHRADYNDYKSMSEYIDGVMTIVQQLSDIGRAIDDKEVSEILLSGLPRDYDVLVSSLESANISDKLTSESVRSRLLQEEFRRNTKQSNGNGTSNDMAFFSKSKIICHYCHKKGHIKSKCFKMKRDRKSGQFSEKKTEEGTMFASAFSACSSCSPGDWIIDSGCSSHMSHSLESFTSLNRKFTSTVSIANGEKLKCCGLGNINLNLDNNQSIPIDNVMYVPNLFTNLLSVSQLVSKGYKVIFEGDMCNILKKNSVIARASRIKGVYRLECVTNSALQVNCSNQSAHEMRSALLWHQRLGHLSGAGMCKLLDISSGLNYSKACCQLPDCVTCIQGKQTVKSFPSGEAKRANNLLELIHSDVCGPMQVTSWGGARYLVTFTDDFSRKTVGYLIKNKNEVLNCFINFKDQVEKQIGLSIKVLRSDGGGEYCNADFTNYLSIHGIIHQVTMPYSPQQNGVAERLNRTLLEKVRCMLFDAKLGKRYWGEAVMSAIYLKNRSPTAAVPDATPEQLWTGNKVDLSHLKVFGCRAYALIPKCNRRKLDAKSKELIFVGYCDNSKGYRLSDPINPSKIVLSRNVQFIESSCDINDIISNRRNMDNNNLNNEILLNNGNMNNESYFNKNEINNEYFCVNPDVVMEPSIGLAPSERESPPAQQEAEQPSVESSMDSSRTTCVSPTHLDSSIESFGSCKDDIEVCNTRTMASPCTSQRPERSTRGIAPKKYTDYDMCLFSHAYLFEEPQSYNDAMASSNKVEWEKAMNTEYESLIKNSVWTLVDRPADRNIIKCKWVYKVKQDTSGCFDKFRARLVARGFSQEPGIDYDKTFAPVVRHSTMRVLFNLANELDMDIDHVDVTTAFLYGNLIEEIYMEQPEGFIINKNKVCLLRKSIYGLKQASRVWNMTVNNLLTKHGYSQTKCEPCVYFKRGTCNNALTILAVYVDDFYIFTNNVKDKDHLIDLLSKNFSVKCLGPIKDCLGMNVQRDKAKGIIVLRQSEYIKKLLYKFKMSEAKEVSTPMIINEKFNNGNNNFNNELYNYRELIGSLMYLSVCTRPDISFCCSLLSQFNNNYNEHHWIAAKRVLRYLKKTINFGLVFKKSVDKKYCLEAFADADWANDPTDRKSFSGFVIKLGSNTINWECRKQRTVALSSTEAEYLSMSDCCKDILFMYNFLSDLTGWQILCKLRNDNMSAIKLLESKECHKRTKHIDVRYHFMKDLISRNIITVTYLQTDHMIADILTKALSSVKHNQFMNDLNVLSM